MSISPLWQEVNAKGHLIVIYEVADLDLHSSVRDFSAMTSRPQGMMFVHVSSFMYIKYVTRRWLNISLYNTFKPAVTCANGALPELPCQANLPTQYMQTGPTTWCCPHAPLCTQQHRQALADSSTTCINPPPVTTRRLAHLTGKKNKTCNVASSPS